MLLNRLFSLWRNLRHRCRVDHDLDEELRATFDLLVDEKIQSGLSPDAARRLARMELGSFEALKADVREIRAGAVVDAVWQDMRYGVRLAWRNPVFMTTAGATLAICIAVSTALFTLVNNVLLRPLAIAEPEQVVVVYNSYPNIGGNALYAGAAVPDYLDRLRELDAVAEHALFNTGNASLDVQGVPERVPVMNVTPSFFRVARVSPQLGRTFANEEGEVGGDRVVVLSDALARRLFAQGDVIGKPVRIDGRHHTVVGVMATGFTFINSDVQMWLPAVLTDQLKQDGQRHANNWQYIGRLAAGRTIDQVQMQVNAINLANLDRFPQFKQIALDSGFRSIAVPLQAHLVRDVKRPLYLLWGGAAFVLLIGSINVASLVFARSQARRKELATRTALGASRTRLVRQMVTEYLMLALLATAAGLVMSQVALRWSGNVNVAHLPPALHIQVDGTVVAYAIATALVVGLLLGVIPLLGSHGAPGRLLSSEGRTTTQGRAARTLRRALVVAQVSIAFLLLSGAGLLLASFRGVLAIDPGFTADDVVTASVDLPAVRYPDAAAVRRLSDDLLGAIRQLPGVVAAGATTSIPFGAESSTRMLLAEGPDSRPGDALLGLSPYRNVVTPGYFEAMQVRLLRGRFFDDRDTPAVPRSIIIDETLARRAWPGTDPIGRRIYFPNNPKNPLVVGDKAVALTVVGVIGDVRLKGLVEGVGELGAFYLPQAQSPQRGLTIAVRGSAGVAPMPTALERVIRHVDHELAVYDVQTMNARTDRSLLARRSFMHLSIVFGAVALCLAAIGIYGVLAFLVVQRTKEIGIRLALGSSRWQVFQLILREGLLLIGVGVVVGAAGALALRQNLESQLFGVHATDPAVLSIALAILGLVALVACVVPARRATAIDPVIAFTE